MQPHIILWTDAYSLEDIWQHIHDYSPKDELPNVTVGYLMKVHNGYIHVSATIDQDSSNFCTAIAIPLEMVVFIAPLRIRHAEAMASIPTSGERYLQGKFAQQPEMVNLVEIFSRMTPVREPLSQPISD